MVSDDFRYRLYGREGKKGTDWVERAYGNLLRLRDRHPYAPNIGGGAELSRRLLAPQAPVT